MSHYAELRDRLGTQPDHPRFVGVPIDIGGLSPDELGALWPLLQRVQWSPDAGDALRQQAGEVLRQAAQRGLLPRLDNAGLLATLQAVPSGPVHLSWLLGQVRYLAPLPGAGLEAALLPRLPPEERWFADRHALLAIARATGADGLLARLDALIAGRPAHDLAAREYAALRAVAPETLFALAFSGHYTSLVADEGEEADPAAMLAAEPDEPRGYLHFARAALAGAAEQLARLHAGELPYVADAAFDRDDALVLGMAARVAATRDEAWYAGLIGPLLAQACVAPTAARTAPSQALTVALGHAIEAVPTPEGVLALRQALALVRHAGLQKKLARHQKPAERGLAARPAVALRLLDAGLAPKALRALLVQFFERCFVEPLVLPYGAWRARLLANKTAAEFARGLVWRSGAAWMLGPEDRPLDAQGEAVAVADDEPVTLWHPVEADEAEREAWRARILAQQLRQPLRQVFREWYRPTDGELFAGYELDAVPLVGLARREGWKLDHDGLLRRFGDLRALFVVSDRLYPGCGGAVASRALLFRHGAATLAPAAVPPRVLSEACRAVDLLVSVSSVALDTEDGNPCERSRRLLLLAGQTGRDAMRRRVLAALLAPRIADGSVKLDGFHVEVGGARVSMRTGRVLRDGAPVELALPASDRKLGAVPWLPYDEALLERVMQGVAALLGGA
ncbi:DUF4132 domain-containing protein [Massilia sp. YIM B02769]|uniref:DUF4132 domain-containing protein n=1 Tax=Massilia sp. YIM B02769 TaxID=3050129 RepID=UPI0025B64057|nr:DUF4132 domain-containing protein [Massilia sp. YIM B02769]MDN4058630.1 DUF4132 domain-containing protein [Massilia sp. YIM B02769]